jgi:hypothetical protein
LRLASLTLHVIERKAGRQDDDVSGARDAQGAAVELGGASMSIRSTCAAPRTACSTEPKRSAGMTGSIEFRNSLDNRGTVKNRKVSRLRSFFHFCRMRRGVDNNPAEFGKPSREQEPQAEYLQPDEFTVKSQNEWTSAGHTWIT